MGPGKPCQDNLWHQGCRLVLVHPGLQGDPVVQDSLCIPFYQVAQGTQSDQVSPRLPLVLCELFQATAQDHLSDLSGLGGQVNQGFHGDPEDLGNLSCLVVLVSPADLVDPEVLCLLSLLGIPVKMETEWAQGGQRSDSHRSQLGW